MNNINISFKPSVYSVYARINNKGKVIKVFSTCFEEPNDDDIFIKSGSGDPYTHVGYYQIFNMDGTHKYCIDNGEMRECTAEEIEAEKATFPAPPPTTEERLEQLELEQNEVNAEMLYEISLLQLGM